MMSGARASAFSVCGRTGDCPCQCGRRPRSIAECPCRLRAEVGYLGNRRGGQHRTRRGTPQAPADTSPPRSPVSAPEARQSASHAV
eukprot:2982649-Rhodomonas_salina.5